MDIHGWVPVEVVCGFRRVRQLSINEEAVIHVFDDYFTYLLPSFSQPSFTAIQTRSSAIAEGLCDAPCQLKLCEMLHIYLLNCI